MSFLHYPLTISGTKYIISKETIIKYINGLGLFAREILAPMTEECRQELISDIGKLLLGIVEGIDEIQVERDTFNRAAGEAPMVRLHEMVGIKGDKLRDSILEHLPHLQAFWSAEHIDKIERDHSSLLLAYQYDLQFRSAIQQCTANTSFGDSWALAKGRWDALRDFCGGFATIFLNTASMEYDFSIVNQEKDAHRLGLMDLSLAGIMHSKQHDLLNRLD
jgi:hypothetical protein